MYIRNILFFFAFVLSTFSAFLDPQVAQAKESHAYITQVPDDQTFDSYSRVLGSERVGKFVIDVKTKQMVFFDVNLYPLHVDFVFQVLYQRKRQDADIAEYNLNYNADKPRFIFGYLVKHLQTKDVSFAFWSGDQIRANDIRYVYRRLQDTFFRKDVKFRPESPKQEALLAELSDIPHITNDQIYQSAKVQMLNAGHAIGTLRIVPIGTPYDRLVFDRNDIVILQESYPDISPVSGILSSIFSTPLSHVNLRAKAWDIPNAGCKDAATTYAAFDGKMVSLVVTDTQVSLRLASPKEIRAFEQMRKQKHQVRMPLANLSVKDLRLLSQMNQNDAVVYGTKAANLGHIVSSFVSGIDVPLGFGIPFFFYEAHMKKHHLDKRLDQLLSNRRFTTDSVFRKQALQEFRNRIVQAPMDPRLLSMVFGKIQQDLHGHGVFVRSSTNAEDLEGFNGAGLYETVPNVVTEKALEEAIKIVWASLWNFHAVEERNFFHINHRSCKAGVLIQVGVNATAAGVLITKNIYDAQDLRSFTINAKHGLGLRVVSGKNVPEQMIYDPAIQGARIISRSNDPVMLVFDEKGGVQELPNPNQGVILTEARAESLAKAVQAIVPLFSRKHALDIEWVLEGEKVWIVQSRPYVSKE